jgi:hypothetical protein
METKNLHTHVAEQCWSDSEFASQKQNSVCLSWNIFQIADDSGDII